MTVPDISVVTPTFRRERQVVEAVRSALGQRGVSVEVTVLDDSPDGSARSAVEGIGDPRVRYVKRNVPTGGRPAIVRNEGAALARGRYLHFLDDDDMLADGALAALADALDRRSDIGVAFGIVVPFGEDEAVLRHQREFFERATVVGRRIVGRRRVAARMLFSDTPLVNSACMIRRELFGQLGGYDADLAVFEDVEFFMRAARRFGIAFIDRHVLHYRTGAPSLMHNLVEAREAGRKAYAQIYKKYRKDHGSVEFYALKVFARVQSAVGL